MSPFFSIVVPTRNRPDLISGLTSSLLRQSFKNFEILLIDNSDNDETFSQIETFKDKKLSYLRTGGLTMADNWESGIREASGDYIILLSDKIILKKDALQFLYEKIGEQGQPDCVIWSIDAYYELEGQYFSHASGAKWSWKDSKALITEVFNSELDSPHVPCHGNSAVSKRVVDKIRKKNGRLCLPVNPDYMMAFQILLSTKKVLRLGQSLTVLRYPKIGDGYGNGTSFMLGTGQSQEFLRQNASIIKTREESTIIPMDGMVFCLSYVLDDLYTILRLYDVDPEYYLSIEKRRINYLYFCYLELMHRLYMGADIKEELKIWKKLLSEEKPQTRSEILRLLKTKRRKIAYIYCIRFIRKIPIINFLIRKVGDRLFRNNVVHIKSIDELLNLHLLHPNF